MPRRCRCLGFTIQRLLTTVTIRRRGSSADHNPMSFTPKHLQVLPQLEREVERTRSGSRLPPIRTLMEKIDNQEEAF